MGVFLDCLKQNYNIEEYHNTCNLDIISEQSPIHNADEYLYSNSELMSHYGNAKDVNINDNSRLDEVVKLIKDIFDKHFYVQNVTWKVDVKNRRVKLSFYVQNSDDGSDAFFLEGLVQHVLTSVARKFADTMELESKEVITIDDKLKLQITIKDLGDKND